MTVLPESARKLIESGPLAHLVTLNPDGSPQMSGVWVGLEGDEIVIAHMKVWKKVQNVQRDPRVALSMNAPGKNAMGLQEYLVVHGTARITEGGAGELLHRLALVYIGPDQQFMTPEKRGLPGYITRITPTRVGGVGPWVQ